MRDGRLWRLAYAVAAQSLLIALSGFALPAQANEGAPGFELCLHDTQGGIQATSEAPAGNPNHSACTHCIFCFAGSYHAVIEAMPAAFHGVHLEIVEAPWAADERGLHRLPAYSIASPRAPRFGA